MSAYMTKEDLYKKIEALERRIENLESMNRATRMSIGSGGLTVKDGGDIEILDENDEPVLTLSADEGLTLSGLLQMLADANIQTFDADGDLRSELGNNLFFRDKTTGEVVLSIGLLGSGNYGLVIEAADGIQDLGVLRKGFFLVTFADGSEAIRSDSDFVQIRYGQDPGAGQLAVDIGDRILLLYPNGNQGFQMAGGQMAQRYGDGTDCVIIDTEYVVVGPGTRGTVIRVTEADGIRVAVDTDGAGVQSGPMTAGAADSAGTGFRALRIPN